MIFLLLACLLGCEPPGSVSPPPEPLAAGAEPVLEAARATRPLGEYTPVLKSPFQVLSLEGNPLEFPPVMVARRVQLVRSLGVPISSHLSNL